MVSFALEAGNTLEGFELEELTAGLEERTPFLLKQLSAVRFGEKYVLFMVVEA